MDHNPADSIYWEEEQIAAGRMCREHRKMKGNCEPCGLRAELEQVEAWLSVAAAQISDLAFKKSATAYGDGWNAALLKVLAILDGLKGDKLTDAPTEAKDRAPDKA